MVVSISQPTYLPWLGYFELIAKADTFVFLDTVQFEKQSWQSRNRLKGANGQPFWLSVPVASQPLNTPLQDIRIAPLPANWASKHLQSIRMSLSRAPYFAEVFPHLEEWLEQKYDSLAELNIAGIRRFCLLLQLQTPLLRSSELAVSGAKVDLVLEILKATHATHYRANAGARSYTDEAKHRFEEANLSYSYQNWTHPQYPQLHGEFLSHLAFPDPLCNIGLEKAAELLRKTTP